MKLTNLLVAKREVDVCSVVLIAPQVIERLSKYIVNVHRVNDFAMSPSLSFDHFNTIRRYLFSAYCLSETVEPGIWRRQDLQ